MDQELDQVERELAKLEAEPEDADVRLPVQLTPLGAQILVHLQRQTQQRRGEIIDRLLREHGSEQMTAA